MREDLTLEMMNGNWAILAIFTTFFLGFHLWDVSRRRGVTIQQWFTDLPQSMQLAVALFTISVGVVLSRAPVWYWRFTSNGDPARLGEIKIWLTLGAAIGCLGFMCAIRVITRPMMSHWPWLMSAGVAVIYTLATLFIRYV